MSSSKKNWPVKGFLQQVFVRVYRLEMQSVMLVFLAHLCDKCCPSDLLSGSTHLPPFPVWISINLYMQCVREGVWGSGPQTDKHRPFTENFFSWWHFALPSMSLIFLRYCSSPLGLLGKQLMLIRMKTERYVKIVGHWVLSMRLMSSLYW
jgi:hypothetical protein